MTETVEMPRRQLSAVRRIAIIVIVVSMSIAAVIGIITLLTGEFGELQSKTMMTTLIVGLFGMLTLCDLAVAGRRYAWSGYLGILSAAVFLVVSLLMTWLPSGTIPPDWVWKLLWLSIVAAASFAHANLLLLLADRRRREVRLGLWITIALIAILAILIALLIITDGEIGDETFARILGIVAILDVLGTIVVPVIGAVLRDDAPGTASAAGFSVPVSGETVSALRRIAAERGTTDAALAASVLDDFVSAHPE